MTSKRLRSQHFLSFSQFYSISDRSVDVAPSRISTLHPIRQSSQVCQMRVPKSQGRERELQTLHLQLHLQTQAQVLQLLQQVSPYLAIFSMNKIIHLQLRDV